MNLPGTDQPVSDVERDLSQKLVSTSMFGSTTGVSLTLQASASSSAATEIGSSCHPGLGAGGVDVSVEEPGPGVDLQQLP